MYYAKIPEDGIIYTFQPIINPLVNKTTHSSTKQEHVKLTAMHKKNKQTCSLLRIFALSIIKPNWIQYVPTLLGIALSLS